MEATVKSVAVKLDIPEQDLIYLVNAAIEGGINYWAVCRKYDHRAGTVEIKESECDGEGSAERPGWHKITPAKMVKGIQICQAKYPRHVADFLKGGGDADTADAILQCAVFGEIVYG